MFDIGFSELFVVAVVALIVLGPERLPRAARFAGLWVRRARAQWHSVKTEWESELADDELKRSLRETREQLEQAQDRLRDSGRNLQRDLDSVRRGIADDIDAGRDRPRREPEPGAPAERDPDPGEPTRRDPDDDAPERRDPGHAPPRRDPDPETGVPVPGDPRTDVPVEEPGDDERAEDADWRQRQRREHELIERELAGFDPDADDDDQELQVGPRIRKPPAGDGPPPAQPPGGPAGQDPAPAADPPPDTDPPRPHDPPRDHDKR